MNRSTGGFDRPIAKSRWQDEEEDIGGTYQNQDEGEDNDQAVDQAGYGSRKAKRRCAEHALASFHTGTQGIGDRVATVGGYATAADRALAEIEEFERIQAELNGDGRSEDREEAAFMNPSPDVSSPEEDMHIRREGNSPHQKAGLVTTEEMRTEGTTAIGPQPASYAESSPGTAWYPEVANSPTSDLILDKEGNQKEENSSGLEKSEDHVRDNQQGELVELNELPATGEATSHRHHISMLNECRSVDIYEKLNRISEGTYGVVYRARDRQTGKICALKRIKLDKERDGFPLTSIREINILLSLSHPSIVNVSEVVVGSSLDSIFMVMEYADHDLKSVMDQRMRQPFSIAEVKCLMLQLLSGIAYLHANWVIHRDLKTSNILYTNRGELKICDFGLARQYGEPLKPYTHLVVTLWYRAPELLLGARTYSTAVDVWSCGCIMAELLAKSPLFQGANELSQLDLIFKNLGYPTNETWPGVDALPNYKKFKFKASGNGLLRSKFPPPGPVFDGRPTISAIGFDLLTGLLDLCPEKRLSAAQAMDHAWFREHPLPKDPSMMPTFPGTNE